MPRSEKRRCVERDCRPVMGASVAIETNTRLGPSRNVLPGCGHGLRIARCQTLPAIIGNRTIDDRAAVDALPGVENQEEVGKPLQHHQAFALRTFHRILPGVDVHSCGVPKQELHQIIAIRNFNTLGATYLSPRGKEGV